MPRKQPTRRSKKFRSRKLIQRVNRIPRRFSSNRNLQSFKIQSRLSYFTSDWKNDTSIFQAFTVPDLSKQVASAFAEVKILNVRVHFKSLHLPTDSTGNDLLISTLVDGDSDLSAPGSFESHHKWVKCVSNTTGSKTSRIYQNQRLFWKISEPEDDNYFSTKNSTHVVCKLLMLRSQYHKNLTTSERLINGILTLDVSMRVRTENYNTNITQMLKLCDVPDFKSDVKTCVDDENLNDFENIPSPSTSVVNTELQGLKL